MTSDRSQIGGLYDSQRLSVQTAPAAITFFAPGEPKAQPRPRAFARKMGGKFVARVYDAGTAEGWKNCIAIAARAHLPAGRWRLR